MTKQAGAITVAGDDPRKFAAAVAEYSKKVSDFLYKTIKVY